MLEKDKTKKRVERHDDTQEDFTPIGVVNSMLDQYPEEAFKDMKKTFIDYSAGNGNFLVEILDRKLDNSKNVDDAIEALKSIYGVELMADNVEECRERLYALMVSRYPKVKMTPELGLRLVGETSTILAETYDKIGACAAPDMREQVSSMQMVDFIDPGVAEPLIDVQGKLENFPAPRRRNR